MTAKSKDFADFFRGEFKNLESKIEAALPKAINRMLAHCYIIEKSDLNPDHIDLKDYVDELNEFAEVAYKMQVCLESWDIHADSFDVKDE